MVSGLALVLLYLWLVLMRILSLAEILDAGYPQNSETDTLKMYITTEGVKSEQAVVRICIQATAPLETGAEIKVLCYSSTARRLF